MPRSIDLRLRSLAGRRKGADRLDRVSLDQALGLVADGLKQEDWERRASSQPNTRYALGAMEAVDRRYTEISIETADRVGKQLKDRLTVPVEFRLQGSVPLDVHIRGVSDVDLLTLDQRLLLYDTHGVRGRAGRYPPTPLTSVSALLHLRFECERVLPEAFPAVKIDKSGSKAISMLGGSLARPVDVVPSHWWDTADHQAGLQEHDRGVYILDRSVPTTHANLPFLHIKRIVDADVMTFGGLRKAIRLTKNVKNDADDHAAAGKLSSFDIAALLFHADRAALGSGLINELAVLRETQRFLDWCWNNKDAARALWTPDGSRRVLDADAKMDGLRVISAEMDDLAKSVAREQLSSLRLVEPSWSQVDFALRQAMVPRVA